MTQMLRIAADPIRVNPLDPLHLRSIPRRTNRRSQCLLTTELRDYPTDNSGPTFLVNHAAS